VKQFTILDFGFPIGRFGCNKIVAIAVSALMFVLCVSAQAQPKGKPKIGVLTPAERQWEGAAFREGLRNLGYIEGSIF
jgi:hypothetical protein